VRKAFLEINGTSKLPGDWGVEHGSLECSFMSLGADRMSFTVVKIKLTDAPIAASGDAVRLLAYEVDATGNPTGDPEILFVGEVLDYAPMDGTSQVRERYECVNAWMLLERTTFYQNWSSISTSAAGSTLACLFFNTTTIIGDPAPGYPGGYPYLPGTKLISVGRQIYDAIYWLQSELGAGIQLGQAATAVEPTDLYIPSVQKHDIKVWEAIRIGLEKAPDVVSRFDYSTVPPSIYFERRANLPAVTLTLGEDISAASPTPRNSLVTPAVHLMFVASNSVDGNIVGLTTTHQYYPASAWDAAKMRLKSEYLLAGSLTQTVVMSGSSVTTLTSEFYGIAVAPTVLAWWKDCCPSLRDDMKIDQSNATAIDFQDVALNPEEYDAGKYYSPGWTCQELNTGAITPPDIREQVKTGWYRVTEGQVPQWLIDNGTYAVKRVRFYAWMDIEQRSGALAGRAFHFEATITTCPPGSYTTTTSVTAAEEIPVGLAQQVQQALSQVYYEGGLVIREQFPTGQVRVGNVVNLLGSKGEATFSTMRAIVQKVTVNYDTGITSVDFGLPRWLGVAELVDFFRISRTPLKWVNAEAMGDGTKASGGGDISSSQGIGNDNLSPGEANEYNLVIQSKESSLDTTKITGVVLHGGTGAAPSASVNWKGKTVAKVSAGSNRGVMNLLAAAEDADPVEKVLVQALEEGGRLVLTGNGSVEIDSSLCNGKSLYVRECEVCVNNVVKRAMVIMSDPY
jgi:hypothetical protein